MKTLMILLIFLTMACRTLNRTSRIQLVLHAGANKGGITENTDIAAMGKLPDAFSGATSTGFHLGIRAKQSYGGAGVESGVELMHHRQLFDYNDLDWGFEGKRELVLSQLNVPIVIGIPLFSKSLPKAGLCLQGGYLMQFNHLHSNDQGNVPAFGIDRRSGGATLSLSGNLISVNNRPQVDIYGSLYRGSRIYTDPYNPHEAEKPGSSFAAFGLRFYLFER